MKKLYRNIGIVLAFAAMAITSCSLEDLKTQIQVQNERLTLLENALEEANNNTLAASALMKDGILITSFTDKKDKSGKVIGYDLELNNGEKIEVYFGDEMAPIVPMIGIDQEGRFICSMDGGETFSPIEGAPNANGHDGITPLIDLDKEGFWVISKDQGKTWERMNDANGLPVNAFQATSVAGNKFFSDIRFDKETGIMHFDLRNGEKLQVRVSNTVIFKISHYTPDEELCLGEMMKYPVDIQNIQEAFFTVPDGWRAVLSEDYMEITAPEKGEAGNYEITLSLTSPTGMLKSFSFTYKLKAVPAEKKWKLDWEEEFDLGHMDTRSWDYLKRANTTALRYMSRDPRCYEYRESSVVLKAIRNDNLKLDNVPYLTGGISSRDLKEFTVGRLEICARMKSSQGIQPAIWTGSWSGIPWPHGGEIDIMERYNDRQEVSQTLHSHYTYDLGFDKEPVPHINVPLDPSEYHIYRVDRLPEEVVFYIDGKKTLSYPNLHLDAAQEQFPFFSSCHLMLDIQIINEEWGGKVDETKLPAELEIDWVRHYIWK